MTDVSTDVEKSWRLEFMALLFSCCAVLLTLCCVVVLTHCFAGTLFCCFTDTLFCGCQYGWKDGIAMPGGRSEVFRERWMRNGTPLQRAGLVKEQASPRSSALRGENIEAVAAGQGRPRRSGIRCRDGAGADGARVRTASSPRGLDPEGILDSDTLARGVCISGPHRRARKIGVQTAPAARFVPARCLAVPLRPEPVSSARGWRIGCDPGEIPARRPAASTDHLQPENARIPLRARPVPKSFWV